MDTLIKIIQISIILFIGYTILYSTFIWISILYKDIKDLKNEQSNKEI